MNTRYTCTNCGGDITTKQIELAKEEAGVSLPRVFFCPTYTDEPAWATAKRTVAAGSQVAIRLKHIGPHFCQ
jgi:hypothetical protein